MTDAAAPNATTSAKPAEAEKPAATAETGADKPSATKDAPTTTRGRLIALASGEKLPPKADKPADKPADEKQAKPADAKAKEGDKAPEKKPDEKPTPEHERQERRDYAKARRKLETKEREVTARESTIAEREQRFTEHEKKFSEARQAEIATFKKDPLAWLKANGVNVRQTLLDLAKEDGEEPSAKLAREAKTKADELEKKLTEKEQREQEEAKTAKQREALEGVRRDCAEAWKGVDHDEYPYLSTMYDDTQVAHLAADTAVAYYKRHGREPTLGELFGNLERVLREDDANERKQKAREKAGQANGAKTPGPPDRDRSAKSANLENGERRSTTQDVTSRETRTSTASVSTEVDQRRKYEQMAERR
jgi:hypothetical protein